MRSVLTGLCLAFAAFVAAAPAAHAQDPDADSPAGTIYEIPLEQGREDAAPPARKGQDKDAGTTQPRTGSSIRSDNGFSSSSTVPGASGSSASGSASSGAKSGDSGDKPSRGDKAEKEKDETETENPEAGIPRGTAATTAPRPASVSRTLLLIGLATGVALALAAIAVRSSGRRR